MPLAAVLFLVAWLSGGAGNGGGSEIGNVFLAFHVGLILAAFAGFTLAAGLAGLYLWQERRLKGHAPGVLRQRAPSQAALDTLTGRTILVALPALTLGLAVGLARLGSEGGGFDAVMRSAAVSERPSTSTTLRRDAWPETTRTALGATPQTSARSRASASLARPRSGAAEMRAFHPSPWRPTISERSAPGETVTRMRAIRS